MQLQLHSKLQVKSSVVNAAEDFWKLVMLHFSTVKSQKEPLILGILDLTWWMNAADPDTDSDANACSSCKPIQLHPLMFDKLQVADGFGLFPHWLRDALLTKPRFCPRSRNVTPACHIQPFGDHPVPSANGKVHLHQSLHQPANGWCTGAQNVFHNCDGAEGWKLKAFKDSTFSCWVKVILITAL